jgi:glutaminyl-peptide cyclotransferase
MSASLSPVFATLLALGTITASLPACNQGNASKSSPQSFDSERAWKDLEKLVAFGPRPSGSAAIEETRKFLEAELKAIGLTPVRETFKEETPKGEIEFANVYADFPGKDVEGKKPPILVIGSHFDTKLCDFPFVGANDAGSSTAVLLELARSLKKTGPRDMTLRFIFFDGEEAVRRDWIDPDNTYGSRHHAEKIREASDRDRFRAFVLLDMVGDKDLHLTHDTYSTKKLRDAFFDAAKEIGLGDAVNGRRQSVKDDHLSFRRINIPSVDLIDLEYGPNNSYWHTPADTLENCSRESLDKIGRIVLAGLPAVEAAYGK